MKRFGKVLGLAVLTAAAAVFMGCPTPNSKDDGDTGGGTGLWDTEGIELIDSLANRSTSWGEAIKVPSSYAKRLQAGSKVIFELKEYDNGTAAGPYLKFHVDKGDWTEVGVTKYYDANGTELSVEEDSNNKGVYNSDSIDAGTYYFEVTDSNLNKLKAGFALNGNLTVVRLGITNLAEAEQPAPGAAVYSGDEIVLKVIADSVPDTDTKYKTKLRLQYFRENNKKQEITFSNLDLSVTIGNDVITFDDECNFEINEYGPKNDDGEFSEYDLDLLLGKDLKTNDTVKVQLKKANITGDDDITDDIIASIKVIIFDNAANAGGKDHYYQKLSADEEEKPLITKKNGDPISPAPAE